MLTAVFCPALHLHLHVHLLCTGVKPSATSSSSGSKASAPAPSTDAAAYNLVTGVTAMQASPAAAATPAAAPAQSREPTVALKEVEDSELEKLCQKLGLSRVRTFVTTHRA